MDKSTCDKIDLSDLMDTAVACAIACNKTDDKRVEWISGVAYVTIEHGLCLEIEFEDRQVLNKRFDEIKPAFLQKYSMLTDVYLSEVGWKKAGFCLKFRD